MRSILVSHEGWFLFCPVYWSEEEQEAVAKYGAWWLFDLALEVQQFRNWCLSFFEIESGFPLRLFALPISKNITL